jgi:hypothetical protein
MSHNRIERWSEHCSCPLCRPSRHCDAAVRTLSSNALLERRRRRGSASTRAHAAARSKRWLAGTSPHPFPAPSRIEPDADRERRSRDAQDKDLGAAERTRTQQNAPRDESSNYQEGHHRYPQNQEVHVWPVGRHGQPAYGHYGQTERRSYRRASPLDDATTMLPMPYPETSKRPRGRPELLCVCREVEPTGFVVQLTARR